ncbi:MAG: LmeA family phospholipid-binding protein [Actinomycetaceae bacterium]|nr:LmeA family phospholipid-binding protein [Actinomycetaceae bacterium]
MKKPLVISIVLLVTVVFGSLIIDRVVYSMTMTKIENRLEARGDIANPQVEVHGGSFLLQTSAGIYHDLHFHASRFRTSLDDILVEFQGVDITVEQLHRLSKTKNRAENATIKGKLTMESVQRIVDAKSPVALTMGASDGRIVASAKIFHIPVSVAFHVEVVHGENPPAVTISPNELWAGSQDTKIVGWKKWLDSLPSYTVRFEHMPVKTHAQITKIDALGIDLTIHADQIVFENGDTLTLSDH